MWFSPYFLQPLSNKNMVSPLDPLTEILNLTGGKSKGAGYKFHLYATPQGNLFIYNCWQQSSIYETYLLSELTGCC
ncbi:hypothetical protein, partial [Cyclobacterium marinum]|uniref:hypothetical protein n=1 Tax=Cyclobacterium marinum TaxID=104 RepID=UPI0030D8E7E7